MGSIENEKNVDIIKEWFAGKPEEHTKYEHAMLRCIEYLVMDGYLYGDSMKPDDIFDAILYKSNEVTKGK